ncbi:MAG: hypothetical protein FWC12_11685 [Treponema sp.]|nr:hypothetical protein [Treponema sp.]
MKSSVKEIYLVVGSCFILFILGFIAGCLFNECRSDSDTQGVAADVGGYDTAAERVERAASAIGDAAEYVREAAGEVRISIDEAGSIGEIARDIGSGTDRALDGLSDIEDGIQRVMGILGIAEKRNAEMETTRNNGMD